VLLVGDVSHDTCLSLMAASDVFVRATLEDGDSVSVREALSLGVPVVASSTAMRPAGAILFQTGNSGRPALETRTSDRRSQRSSRMYGRLRDSPDGPLRPDRDCQKTYVSA